jgi:hypothetical protein
VLAADRPNTPAGEIVTFEIDAFDRVDPAPSVVSVPPPGSLFPRGTTLVRCVATDASGNVSTCEFPVHVRVDGTRAGSGRADEPH